MLLSYNTFFTYTREGFLTVVESDPDCALFVDSGDLFRIIEGDGDSAAYQRTLQNLSRNVMIHSDMEHQKDTNRLVSIQYVRQKLSISSKVWSFSFSMTITHSAMIRSNRIWYSTVRLFSSVLSIFEPVSFQNSHFIYFHIPLLHPATMHCRRAGLLPFILFTNFKKMTNNHSMSSIRIPISLGPQIPPPTSIEHHHWSLLPWYLCYLHSPLNVTLKTFNGASQTHLSSQLTEISHTIVLVFEHVTHNTTSTINISYSRPSFLAENKQCFNYSIGAKSLSDRSSSTSFLFDI